jgi:outer membrane immunogenic protein
MKRSLFGLAALAALFTTSAMAADLMPLKAPPPPPAWSWTGCYVGANGGGAWGKDGPWTDASGTVHGTPNFSGGLGGGQVGCDYQFGSWVVGAEGMFDWANLTGSTVDPHSTAFTGNTRVTMFDTATARFGYAVNRALLYVDGGAAWSRTQRYFTPPGLAGGACGADTCATSNTTANGWVIGGGLEYLFLPNLSGKIEYDYASFGSVGATPDISNPYTIKQNINVLLAGINYRFGFGH